MTKSILTGGAVLTVVVALMLALFGAYEISSASAVALGFVGFVLVVLFARFGGFKPFFPTADTLAASPRTAAVDSEDARSLVSVGADAEGPALFDERAPVIPLPPSPPVFDEVPEPVPPVTEPLFDSIPTPVPSTDESRVIRWGDDEPGDGEGAGPTNEESECAEEPAEPNRAAVQVTIVDDGSSGGELVLDDADADALVASLESIAPAPVAAKEALPQSTTSLAATAGTELPVVVNNAPLELHRYSEAEIMEVVRTQEGHLVDTLIDEGVLSTDGPLTDKDIRTMVFVAVSSTELIEVLSEGQRDAVALNGGGAFQLESGDS